MKATAAVTALKRKPDITASLRAAIVSGQILPNERLIEVELASRLATNRVQIRAALSKLEGEGLVVSEPNRGARVRVVTSEEALEITEARAAMESLVAAKAAERATDKDIARLRDILRRMQEAISEGDDIYIIDPNLCTECVGFQSTIWPSMSSGRKRLTTAPVLAVQAMAVASYSGCRIRKASWPRRIGKPTPRRR